MRAYMHMCECEGEERGLIWVRMHRLNYTRACHAHKLCLVPRAAVIDPELVQADIGEPGPHTGPQQRSGGQGGNGHHMPLHRRSTAWAHFRGFVREGLRLESYCSV